MATSINMLFGYLVNFYNNVTCNLSLWDLATQVASHFLHYLEIGFKCLYNAIAVFLQHSYKRIPHRSFNHVAPTY